jgi:DRTGG domain.
MTIKYLLEKTNWKLLNEGVDTDKFIKGVFVGDLLSWVMGNSEERQAWVTVQAHNNVIAVAVLREFSCVIVCQGATIPDDVVEQAITAGMPLISTEQSAFEVCRCLIDLGL